MSARAFFAFAVERHATHLRRTAGAQSPWSNNQVIASRRFCNVFRELDRTTLWLRREWYDGNADHPSLWFAAVVARRGLNRVDGFAAIGFPWTWDRAEFERRVRARMAGGAPVFNSCYRLFHGPERDPVIFVASVLDSIWSRRAEWRRVERTVAATCAWLQTFRYVGPFMAYQVALDLTYTRYLRDAPDRDSHVELGPGSRRGLNRVYGRPVDMPVRDDDGRFEVGLIVDAAANRFWPRPWPTLTPVAVEHALCEFDKYERLRESGTGARPYVPDPRPL